MGSGVMFNRFHWWEIAQMDKRTIKHKKAKEGKDEAEPMIKKWYVKNCYVLKMNMK